MYKYTLLMTDSGYYIWGERRRNRSFDYKIKSINPRGKFDGFKDNRNKEKCKAEHGEKNGSLRKKTSAKSAKSAKTTRKNTTSKAVPQEESFLATEILIWVTLAVGILLTISNFGLAGAFGRKIAALQQGMMGWMAYVFPLLLFCGVAFVVSNKGNRIAYIKTVAGVVLLVQCCVLFELIDEKGGSVGKAIAVRLVPAIGKVGTYVVVIILMVICVVLITEKSILKGMKIGGEKAYDRAREDMQKRKEEAEERRARRGAMRVDYQVSGVSFNSTVGGKENEAEKAEEKAGKEAKESTEKKATRRSRKDMSRVLAGAEEAAAKHIMEQTGKIALDDVVINRAMPLSATELIPDPEPVPLEPVKEKLPKFLKGAMQESRKKRRSPVKIYRQMWLKKIYQRGRQKTE